MSNASVKNDKKPFHEDFAENIIAQLKAGTAPWQKPWKEGVQHIQYNPASKTVYQGVNQLKLAMSGFDDPRWMTFNQARDADYKIQKGSKATDIVFYQFHKEIDKLDDNGNVIHDNNGEIIKEKVKLERPIMRISKVFNATQIDGIPPLEIKKDVQIWEIHQKAEHILKNSNAVIKNDQSNRAFYSLTSDEIHLPKKESFKETGKYYATALHELGHWTGHASRLDRTFGAKGTQAYAKEELRAEIASWMLGNEIGIGHDPEQHVAYIASWIQILKDEPLEIMRACRDAEKAKDLVMGFEKEIEKEQTQEVTTEKNIAQIFEELIHQRRELGALEDKKAQLEEYQKTTLGSHQKNILQKELQKLESDIATQKKNNMVKMTDDANSEKFYLDVPYEERKEARMRGATWDEDAKKWYMTNDQNIYDFKEWRIYTAEELEQSAQRNKELYQELHGEDPPEIAQEKTFLSVPFEEKDNAKKHGAIWDIKSKSWYAPTGTNLAPLKKWLPETQMEKIIESKLSPEEEFASKLQALGLDVQGTPIMDGTIQRVPLQGREVGNKNGAYCGYMDGIPAGWAQNYTTGEKIKFIATGHVLSDAEKAHQQAERVQKLQEREAKRLAQHNIVGDEAFLEFEKAQNVFAHQYLEEKSIFPVGIKINEQNQLLIPIKDINDQVRGIQYITPDGDKFYKKGMEKQGNFCMLEPENIGDKSQILICEGYATGVSLYEATGLHVAVAFDSGNLEAVAINIRKQNPNATLVICADNDHSKKINVGLEKATLSAKSINGTVKVPAFTLAERTQGLTDFNDLHKSQGIEAVKKQLGLEKAINKTKEPIKGLAI